MIAALQYFRLFEQANDYAFPGSWSSLWIIWRWIDKWCLNLKLFSTYFLNVNRIFINERSLNLKLSFIFFLLIKLLLLFYITLVFFF